MKAEDRYLRFVRWSDEDDLYVGYCPDLFPWGGVCHGPTEEETYRQLTQLVREEVEELRRDGKQLPEPATRPMRDAVPA
jgi:predicted RNase H-like HicB family nuclease